MKQTLEYAQSGGRQRPISDVRLGVPFWTLHGWHRRSHTRFQSIGSDATGLKLQYTRIYTGPCSVQIEGAACWAKIAAETHLPPAPAPDCAAGYLRAKQELATARCETAHHKNAACIKQEIDRMQADDASPSVIGYDVDALIQPPQKSIQPVAGPIACWPAD